MGCASSASRACQSLACWPTGVRENPRDPLVVDLTLDKARPPVPLTRMAVMVSSLTCFQLHIHPPSGSPPPTPSGQTNDESADPSYSGQSLTRWLDLARANNTKK